MLFERDNWQEIFATVKKNRLRTFLTCLGVGWGIFMLVIMLGAGNGLKHGVLSDFGGTATNSFFMWTQKTSKAYKGMKPGRNFNFNLSDAAAIRQLPEVDVTSPQNQLGGYEGSNNVVRGLKAAGFEVRGSFPNVAKIEEICITKGRFLNEFDIKEKRKVCVIGTRVQEVLFRPGENPIGEFIRINGIYFRVIGVNKASGNGDQARQEAQRITLPFTTFSNAFNYGEIVGWFAISSKPGNPASQTEEKVLSLVKERHKIAPDDNMAIGHWNMEKEFNKLNGLFSGIEFLIWFVGSGTLIAGVIGISNIMLIVVKERTREIGVKRALGATPYNVISQIMLESVFLTTVAGVFGLWFSILLLELFNSLLGDEVPMFKDPTVDLSVALKALVVLVIAGAFAGLIPARKASAVHPVEALRSE
ncbi:MAG: ABC transporter permease [Bacteroidia bacterium]